MYHLDRPIGQDIGRFYCQKVKKLIILLFSKNCFILKKRNLLINIITKNYYHNLLYNIQFFNLYFNFKKLQISSTQYRLLFWENFKVQVKLVYFDPNNILTYNNTNNISRILKNIMKKIIKNAFYDNNSLNFNIFVVSVHVILFVTDMKNCEK